jgi:transitional endoplasmic reticulum ATPase
MENKLIRHGARAAQAGNPAAASGLIRYWVAQVLSVPAVWRKGWCRHEQRFEHDELLELLRFTPSREGKLRQPPKALSRLLAAQPLAELLAADDIYRNLSRLGERLSLSEAERRLLAFSSHMHVSGLLYRACELVSDCSPRDLISHLARFIDMPESAVREAVGPEGVLRVSRLLVINHSGNFRSADLTDAIHIESELHEVLQIPDVPEALLASLFYRLSEPALLTLDDFVEHGEEVAMLRRLLGRAVTERHVGINVLIYGPPGTGKTQLVRALAESLGFPLAMVPETDRDGDGISAQGRLGRYNACQRALAQDSQTLVAFDEAEDCLCDAQSGFFFVAPRQTPKAGVIRLLESNPRPTLWISNRVDMDEAFLRRFTHVVEIGNPGAKQRQRLVREALADVPVSPAFLDSAARLEKVSPAILHASLAFARLAGEGDQDVERLMTHSLNARFAALDRPERLRVESHPGLPWRPECLRASEDVAALIDEVNAEVPVRFCLHGAPGTGKTAWAQQLAERLGRPLMVRQASDLLNMYVGNTEKLIAAMFREAEQEGAVLLVDEADSFIGSRREARQSWEVSHVNQFLASMEHYQGLFIATTNLLERVDDAAMRRFDYLIRFDCLDVEGAQLLLADLAAAYSIALPPVEIQRAMLQDLKQLTPGDFAALYRRLRVRRQHPDAAGLVALLRDSVAYKHRDARPIGFAAPLH